MATAPIVLGAKKPSAAVIFLHGLGDTGMGWAPVMQHIQQAHVQYICPTAPTVPVTLNMGMRMPAWYDIFSLDKTGPEDAKGIKTTAAAMHKLLDEQVAAGVPSERIVLGGFSQGGAISLYAGLTYNKPLGGIVVLSAYLPLSKEFPNVIQAANKGTPVFMAHGTEDQVLAYKLGQVSAEGLKQMGVNVAFKSYLNMAHSTHPQEIADLQAWLEQQIPPVAAPKSEL